jgi:hypothetical protein
LLTEEIMARVVFTLPIPLLILILVIGFSNAHAVGQLKKVSLAVDGMT